MSDEPEAPTPPPARQVDLSNPRLPWPKAILDRLNTKQTYAPEAVLHAIFHQYTVPDLARLYGNSTLNTTQRMRLDEMIMSHVVPRASAETSAQMTELPRIEVTVDPLPPPILDV